MITEYWKEMRLRFYISSSLGFCDMTLPLTGSVA